MDLIWLDLNSNLNLQIIIMACVHSMTIVCFRGERSIQGPWARDTDRSLCHREVCGWDTCRDIGGVQTVHGQPKPASEQGRRPDALSVTEFTDWQLWPLWWGIPTSLAAWLVSHLGEKKKGEKRGRVETEGNWEVGGASCGFSREATQQGWPVEELPGRVWTHPQQGALWLHQRLTTAVQALR